MDYAWVLSTDAKTRFLFEHFKLVRKIDAEMHKAIQFWNP